MREDPPPDARCRDKFLVQSIAISPDREVGNVTAIVSQLSMADEGCVDKITVAECREDCERDHRGAKDSRGFLTCRSLYLYSAT